MKHIGPIPPVGLILVLMFAACSSPGPASSDTNTSTQGSASPSSTPLTGFERDLQYIRNGQYTYVWVFSRKDGKALQPDDSVYLRTNAPQVVDWVTTDEGRKVIAGTNFNLEEGNLEALKKRFVAEDYTGK
ncbi:MAG TPA: hypothetical protein VGQ41_00715 [Pyrinomonadaceae bacterium]|jgi:hypothetical protein|nr:hypothetical protein [Pyrinomonadaceae bacterium]